MTVEVIVLSGFPRTRGATYVLANPTPKHPDKFWRAIDKMQWGDLFIGVAWPHWKMHEGDLYG